MADDDKKKNEEKPTKEPHKSNDEESSKKNLTKEEKKAQDDEFKKTSTIHVKVYSPFKTYFDDEADSISAENLTGPFDVLAQHRNFITLLVPCTLEIRSEKNGDKDIAINKAVMHVRRNIVTIFLDV